MDRKCKCGKRFTPVRGQIYCGAECRKKFCGYQKKELPKIKICAYEKCKKEFVPEYPTQIHCCDTCRIKRGYENRKERSKEEIAKIDRRKRRPMSELARMAVEAKKAGMSYGKYVAMMERGRR